MKFGLFTCGYQRGALERAFADAADFGYDFIELWGGRPHAYAPDILRGGAAGILRLEEKYGLPVAVYTPEHNAYPYNYMLGSEAQWEDCVDYLSGAVRAGKAVGAGYTLISVGHGGDAPPEARMERLRRTLRALSKTAEECGTGLLLETLTPYESNTCTTLPELEEALRDAPPALHGMCDLAAPFSQGEDPAEYFRRPGARCAHLHITDSDGVSDAHLVLGEGVMPLTKILGDIRRAGYDGTATIELVTRYIDAPGEAARRAIDKVREIL
jgi:protein FrlC